MIAHPSGHRPWAEMIAVNYTWLALIGGDDMLPAHNGSAQYVYISACHSLPARVWAFEYLNRRGKSPRCTSNNMRRVTMNCNHLPAGWRESQKPVAQRFHLTLELGRFSRLHILLCTSILACLLINADLKSKPSSYENWVPSFSSLWLIFLSS